jgi:DNA-binding transcriptional MerR regulator
MRSWKVGELAKRSGISIRTLHYYDEIGLLSPSMQGRTGYRLYTPRDVVRLHRILALRELGCSLDEINAVLDDPARSLRSVLQQQSARLEAQIAQQTRLRERIESLLPRLSHDEGDAAEALLDIMEQMKMFEKYYSPEQLEALKARREALGDARIQEVQAAWPALMAEVQAEMDAGTDPKSDKVKALAARWMSLVREFTGGDSGLERSVQSLYQNEPIVAGMDTSPMRKLSDYIRAALS